MLEIHFLLIFLVLKRNRNTTIDENNRKSFVIDYDRTSKIDISEPKPEEKKKNRFTRLINGGKSSTIKKGTIKKYETGSINLSDKKSKEKKKKFACCAIS